MAKVTIVFEDTESGMKVDANFEQPGASFDEMEANPTIAVATGMAAVRMAGLIADRVEGGATDDDGSPLSIEKVLGTAPPVTKAPATH